MGRRSPTADLIRVSVTTQPVARVVAVTLDGFERLAFTADDLAARIYGVPIDDTDRRRKRDRIVDAWHRGEITGRMSGKTLIFNGAAVADYLTSLDSNSDEQRNKIA